MWDYQTVKLLHRHSDEDWVPMQEGVDHDAAAHDPERSWLRGARLFKCTTCDEQIAVLPETEPAAAPGEIG